ncbi:hypothetical protein MHAE_19781 [Mycobacterium haemophilum DSM 44634]|uniref:PPE family domain-containing protein n=1 Tax=Mycobacterium haemophilum TaxID=29311 RepID=A0A0I9T837_9MYCO|nr:hypothetical protein [Mycobacterium haemophilum]KLO25279.1 hypothetical protein ABH39_20225 [Mycobacterium haemophilum]KLO34157.1 hypothetical protein ABH38_19645 [Mycobacterium haemophilum]KLO37022.1 hypothetical protein ABH37_19280 [Mycobacterium haemophilum]KLO42982.1 hypothetical protein ABH36_20005 [Mycobacterium haemophilum]
MPAVAQSRNAVKVAELDANYEEYWAKDVAAMTFYQGLVEDAVALLLSWKSPPRYPVQPGFPVAHAGGVQNPM